MDAFPKRILLVDDEPAHAEAIRRSLTAAGAAAEIRVAGTLQEYRAAVADNPPDIALLDLNLPDGRAVDVLTSPPEAGPFPVLVMTSYGNEQTAVQALKAGAIDYVVKSAEAFVTMPRAVERALREWDLLQKHKLAQDEIRRQHAELTLAMAELKNAQARVVQQEKMASIGQLAAGVAHEINNPMGYITSNMNTLGKYAKRLARLIELQEAVIANGANEASRTELEEMRSRDKIDYVLKDFDELIAESLEGAERVRKIVQDLKSFSRADSHEPVPCDINDCIRTTANIVHNEIKYVATLGMNLTELPPVVCHPQQISQVLMNLLVNAAHAIEKQGAITIATSHDDQWVSIRISDTGKGIPKEIRERIFEPFFTTKEVGKGTGLGLAISLDIINRHGGELSVESEAGRGTTFTIRLPLARTSGLEGVLENTGC